MLSNSVIARALMTAPAPESYSQEETINEIERVYFAKLSDFEQLQGAPHSEEHEQWEYRLFEGEKPLGTLRSRSIDQGERYELTIKTYRKDDVGSIESNLGSTEDMHQVIAALADRVLRKIRYTFPVSVEYQGKTLELKWEIDVFRLPDGDLYPWVKVDLEVPEAQVPAPAFPFRYDELINASYDHQMTEDERTIVDRLFETVRATR